MNLLSIMHEDYDYYMTLDIKECYDADQYKDKVHMRFPQYIFVSYTIPDNKIDYSSHYTSETDIETEYIEPTLDNIIELWNNNRFVEYGNVTSKNELNRDIIHALIDRDIKIGYNISNANIMLEILCDKQSVVDKLLMFHPKILYQWNEGFILPDWISYSDEYKDIVNKNIHCIEQSILRSLILNHYIDDTSSISGIQMKFNIHTYKDIQLLLRIEDTSKYDIYIRNNILTDGVNIDIFNINKYNSIMLYSLIIDICDLMKYMDIDENIYINDSTIRDLIPSKGIDIIKTSKKYPLGCRRLWKRYYNNPTIVHAYSTYLPHIAFNTKGCLIDRRFTCIMSLSKYIFNNSYHDMIISCSI